MNNQGPGPESFFQMSPEDYKAASLIPPPQHTSPAFLDKAGEKYTYEEGLDAVTRRRSQWMKKRMGQESAQVDLSNLATPFAIAFLGDVHWGSVYTDAKRFDEDIKRIENTPNAYIVWLSNLIDNAIPGQFPDGMLQNELHPEEQVITMRNLITRLDKKGKILGAVTSPCHEGWTAKKTGQDINRLLFDGMNFPVLDNGSILTVMTPGYDYKLALYHQVGPFNSNFNKNHGPQQMQRLNLRGEADVVAAAHHHTGESLQTWYGTSVGGGQKDVVYLRTGCYKLSDKWAVGKYGNQGEPGGQTILFKTDERRMLPFLKPEDAVDALKALTLYYQLVAQGLLGGQHED